MKLYISGPMTGIAEFNFPAFDTARTELERQGHEVFSPADHDRVVINRIWPGKRPEDFPGYADGDITRYFDAVSGGGEFVLDNMMAWDLHVIVEEVDGIVLLPGWERSSGGLAERYAAEAVNKIIYHWHTDATGGWLSPAGEQQYLRQTLKAALAPTEVAQPRFASLIGLCGYAQSGKDTLAAQLVADYGYERISFADALRDMLYALNPIVWEDNCGEEMRVQQLVDKRGWDAAKQVDEVRELLQRLGTEAGRNVLGQDIWVKTALAKCKPGGKYVVSDVRFPNELEAVLAHGGDVVRILRDGVAPVNGHVSETAIDSYFEPGRITLTTIWNLEHTPGAMAVTLAHHLGLEKVSTDA